MKDEIPKTILVIDDDPFFNGFISEFLESHFEEVLSIKDGNLALEFLSASEKKIDMILLDYHLNEMNGLDIIKSLKKQNKEYPVIFLSSESDTKVIVESMKLDSLDFVDKSRILLPSIVFIIHKNYTVFLDRMEKKRLQLELENHKANLEILVKKRTEELEIAMKDLKLTQAQLIQSEKMASLGILLAGVAHEINNPVNYINSSIIGLENVFEDIIQSIKPTSTDLSSMDMQKSIERINKMLTNMKTGVSRTLEIVNSLRTFARTDNDELKPTSIHESIDNTLTILQNQYKNRIQMIKNYGDIPLIPCYPNKIHQVFMNILVNAVQSIEENGKIFITTKHSGRRVFISIEDTGSGIKPEILSKIFDPFFTTKDPGHGTGLGLSIAYNIVNQHKGEIQVKSKLGKGTTFLIELPI